MENVGSVHLRLQPNDKRTPTQLVRADVEISGATLFITLHRETKWPFRIENLSDQDFVLVQSVSPALSPTSLANYELGRVR